MSKGRKISYIALSLIFIALTITPLLKASLSPFQEMNDRNKINDIGNPKIAAEYENQKAGTGNTFNVTLHQAFTNTTLTSLNTTTTMINNSVIVPCPTDTLFNSSFVNMSISDISAPNKTMVVKTSPDQFESFKDNMHGLKFKVAGTAYLENLSIYLDELTGTSNEIRIYLYSTIWDTTNKEMKPSTNLGILVNSMFISAAQFYNVNNLHYPLNPATDTANKTYAIVLFNRDLNTPRLYYDFSAGTTDNDIWYLSGSWLRYTDRNPAMTLEFAPLSNTPNATAIGLQVNGTAAQDLGSAQGVGVWNSTSKFSSASGSLNFTFTADWWDVALSVTKILVNYTRTDIRANSAYNLNINDVNAIWNVTWAATNFSTAFDNFTINATLPADWVIDSAQNSSATRSFSTYVRGDGWQDVKIYDAWNDTYWNITTHISNWITDLQFTKDLVNYGSVFNSTDIVNITAVMNNAVSLSAGIGVNVSIYSPVDISQELNFTYVNESAVGVVKWVNLSWWDVSNNVTAYGQFRAQVFWTNGTHVGYIEKPLTILGVSTMVQREPITGLDEFYNDTTIFGSDRFNLTVYVTDTISGTPIDDMDISYGYDGDPLGNNLTLNGTAGYYNLTVTQADVGFGLHTVDLEANNTFFNNQSFLHFEFTFWNQTTGSIQGDTLKTGVNGDNVTFTALYRFSDGLTPIANAVLDFDPSNTTFQPWATYSAGSYTVMFNTSLIAGRTVSYNLEFNLFQGYNVSHHYVVSIHVLNKTVASIIAIDQITDFGYGRYSDTGTTTSDYYGAFTDVVTAYYGASFNVTARFYDRNNSRGILDGTGATTWANVTIAGTSVNELSLVPVTIDGNYSVKVMTLLTPGNYPAWVKFNDADAWNATFRNFLLRILPCETTIDAAADIEVRQDNYGETLSGTFPTFQATYGANLQIRWRMINQFNGTPVAETILNATYSTTSVLSGLAVYPEITMPFISTGVGLGYGIHLVLNATGYQNKTYDISIDVAACPVTATIWMWQYGYRNDSSSYGPFVDQNISIGISFQNAKNAGYLTTIGQLVIDFNGEVNLTAGTWVNGNWFNSSLNVTGKGIGSYFAYVNMTTQNYQFQNVTIQIDIVITKSDLAFTSIIQGGNALTKNPSLGYYETRDGTVIITLTVTATNVLDHANLEEGTVTLYLESTGAVLGTGTSIGNGQYSITIDPTNLDRNSAFTLRVNFTRSNYQDSSTIISLFIYKTEGIPPEMIYAAVAVAAMVGLIALIYLGPIKKGKKRRQDELLTTASAFEDAINLQHILVIYKNTGTCIYFKSFARESIDPDLISGFLQAVSTFGTEMKVEQALDEMKYGDSVLLLNDGELLRVTLVLSKSPSNVLRANLSRFTITFEDTFREKLTNWRGQLGIFEGADDLVDNLLNASIILPHEVGNVKSMKLVKSVFGRGVLKIAQQMTSGERKFFFLASLVSDSSEGLKRPPAEILIAIDQMRKAGVIRPIKMEQFKEKAVSPQELQLIRQQVQQLKVPQEQAESMVQALAKMEPIEREAALASIKQGKQITTDLTAQLGEIKKVASPDEAAVEVKNLEKKARGFLKEKDFEKAMNSYRAAEVLAFQWSLKEDASRLREVQLSLEVDALKTTFAESMKAAKKAEGKNPAEALEAFKKARDIAQMLFKRGIATAEKDVVSLTSTIKKMESTTSVTEIASTMQGTKKDLLGERKELLGQVKALENQEMWAKLQKVYLRLEQISNELYKMGDMAEAKNVKLYRKQAMKYQDIVSAIQQDQDGGKKEAK